MFWCLYRSAELGRGYLPQNCVFVVPGKAGFVKDNHCLWIWMAWKEKCTVVMMIEYVAINEAMYFSLSLSLSIFSLPPLSPSLYLLLSLCPSLTLACTGGQTHTHTHTQTHLISFLWLSYQRCLVAMNVRKAGTVQSIGMLLLASRVVWSWIVAVGV